LAFIERHGVSETCDSPLHLMDVWVEEKYVVCSRIHIDKALRFCMRPGGDDPGLHFVSGISSKLGHGDGFHVGKGQDIAILTSDGAVHAFGQDQVAVVVEHIGSDSYQVAVGVGQSNRDVA